MQWSGHVAIVDDDASTRIALARLLRANGVDCRTYPSARDFLLALPLRTPDCLIVDVNMPDMTGPDLQRELLNLGIHLPTIVITAIDDEIVSESARSLGAEVFLPKPVGREALMAAVNLTLNRRK